MVGGLFERVRVRAAMDPEARARGLNTHTPCCEGAAIHPARRSLRVSLMVRHLPRMAGDEGAGAPGEQGSAVVLGHASRVAAAEATAVLRGAAVAHLRKRAT